MRKRINLIVIGIVLAVLSFAYGRYDYTNKHTLAVVDAKITLASHDLFGDWVKDEWVFAIALPVAFFVGGLALAARK